MQQFRRAIDSGMPLIIEVWCDENAKACASGEGEHFLLLTGYERSMGGWRYCVINPWSGTAEWYDQETLQDAISRDKTAAGHRGRIRGPDDCDSYALVVIPANSSFNFF